MRRPGKGDTRWRQLSRRISHVVGGVGRLGTARFDGRDMYCTPIGNVLASCGGRAGEAITELRQSERATDCGFGGNALYGRVELPKLIRYKYYTVEEKGSSRKEIVRDR